MECFAYHLPVIYIPPEDAEQIFSENELTEVALDGFSIVSLSMRDLFMNWPAISALTGNSLSLYKRQIRRHLTL